MPLELWQHIVNTLTTLVARASPVSGEVEDPGLVFKVAPYSQSFIFRRSSPCFGRGRRVWPCDRDSQPTMNQVSDVRGPCSVTLSDVVASAISLAASGYGNTALESGQFAKHTICFAHFL